MQVFNYAFNLGGDFSVKMEGMSEAMGEFNANISATQQGIGKITQTLATFNIATDFFTNISEAFSGITEAGSAAELQLMNLKTLFGGNAEAANDMYERISEYGKVTCTIEVAPILVAKHSGQPLELQMRLGGNRRPRNRRKPRNSRTPRWAGRQPRHYRRSLLRQLCVCEKQRTKPKGKRKDGNGV